MVDYHKTSGTTGDMMIRDLGSVVEFWFRAGYDNDHWDPLNFNITANGSTSGTIGIDYNTGRPWVKVGSRTISTSQIVTFRLLTTTGTQGMGGPTTFSVSISRGTIPDEPSIVRLTQISFQSMLASFSDGQNGGSPIDARQIRYNNINSGTGGISTTVYSDGSTVITGLQPATRYYFWARTHNVHGWSGWSPVNSAVTLAGANVKVGLVWKKAIPYVRTGGVWKQALPFSKRAGVWRQGQ